MAFSVAVPVYRNSPSLPELVQSLAAVGDEIRLRHDIELEVVFVVDGSPDDSFAILQALLPSAPFRSQLLLHSRNFGSFAAIRTGLAAGSGPYYGMISADLQEPSDLLVSFVDRLVDGSGDIVIGVRETRDDPGLTSVFSGLFWSLYRRLVFREIPEGGVDLFGCTGQVRDNLLALDESNSSLVGLAFWLGFRRAEVRYVRKARPYGKSAWTIGKKVDYLLNSLFAFTDLPIRLLTFVGLSGTCVAVLFGIVVILARLVGGITISGYATTVLVVTFFGALNILGIGVIGHYAWRAYENTKRRPSSIVWRRLNFKPHSDHITDPGEIRE